MHVTDKISGDWPLFGDLSPLAVQTGGARTASGFGAVVASFVVLTRLLYVKPG